uniref:Uncharacterized protein n=1 Tax=Solanum tuberosum TaxID=4113 RepID=M1DDB6_SOLTU
MTDPYQHRQGDTGRSPHTTAGPYAHKSSDINRVSRTMSSLYVISVDPCTHQQNNISRGPCKMLCPCAHSQGTMEGHYAHHSSNIDLAPWKTTHPYTHRPSNISRPLRTSAEARAHWKAPACINQTLSIHLFALPSDVIVQGPDTRAAPTYIG